MSVRITALIEDSWDNEALLNYEHGLSLYIETEERNILFDTGQSGGFIENAKLLHKDLNKLDCIVLSHGHYDHAGGFIKLTETIAELPELIVGEEFFLPKYKKIGKDEYKYLGLSFDEEFLRIRKQSLKKISKDLEYLTDKIIIFHNFTRYTNFEPINDKFWCIRDQEYDVDEFRDEIVLGILTEKGLVVIAGCSHIGIINILCTIQTRTGYPVYALVGGTHLIEADENRLEKTVQAFQAMNIKLIAVSHCTGDIGTGYMKRKLPDRFINNNTGNIIEIAE